MFDGKIGTLHGFLMEHRSTVLHVYLNGMQKMPQLYFIKNKVTGLDEEPIMKTGGKTKFTIK